MGSTYSIKTSGIINRDSLSKNSISPAKKQHSRQKSTNRMPKQAEINLVDLGNEHPLEFYPYKKQSEPATLTNSNQKKNNSDSGKKKKGFRMTLDFNSLNTPSVSVPAFQGSAKD